MVSKAQTTRKAGLRTSAKPVIDPATAAPEEEGESLEQQLADLREANRQLAEAHAQGQQELNRANIRNGVLEQRVNELNKEIVDIGARATEINIAYQQLQQQHFQLQQSTHQP